MVSGRRCCFASASGSAEVLADGVIRAFQQARGAVALAAEQPPAYVLTRLARWTMRSRRVSLSVPREAAVL